jgi:hypothetical protein
MDLNRCFSHGCGIADATSLHNDRTKFVSYEMYLKLKYQSECCEFT